MRDPSGLETAVRVRGEVLPGGYRVVTLDGSSIPNSPAALMLRIRDAIGQRPHIYFESPGECSARPSPAGPVGRTCTSAERQGPVADGDGGDPGRARIGCPVRSARP
ncbi:hypothetical protein [Streptomyces iranensis]|uniref:hypothetical protein n=1 Tax=Streptomyces iranensis TaxID=576784 RepID=UPI0039B75B92